MFKRILGPIAALMGAAAILLSMPLPPHSAGRGLFDLQTILFLVPFGLYVTCALLCILFRWECSPFLVTLGILFGGWGGFAAMALIEWKFHLGSLLTTLAPLVIGGLAVFGGFLAMFAEFNVGSRMRRLAVSLLVSTLLLSPYFYSRLIH